MRNKNTLNNNIAFKAIYIIQSRFYKGVIDVIGYIKYNILYLLNPITLGT